jgi:hypothetical protein
MITVRLRYNGRTMPDLFTTFLFADKDGLEHPDKEITYGRTFRTHASKVRKDFIQYLCRACPHPPPIYPSRRHPF